MSEDWLKVHRRGQRLVARDVTIPTRRRVEAAALGWADASGHARFGLARKRRRGTLRTIVSTVDRTTGEVRPINEDYLREVIDGLVTDGLLDRGSCSACLIVASRRVGGGRGCATCPCRFAVGHARAEKRQQAQAERRELGVPTRAQRRVDRKRRLRAEEREEEVQMDPRRNSITAAVDPDDMPALLEFAAQLQRRRAAVRRGDPDPDRRGLRVVAREPTDEPE